MLPESPAEDINDLRREALPSRALGKRSVSYSTYLKRRRDSPLSFEKFHSIAHTIKGMESSSPRDFERISPRHFVATARELCRDEIDLDDERRVSLSRRNEVPFNPDVQFAVGATHSGDAEPTSAASCEEFGLWQLFPTQRRAVVCAFEVFTSRWTGDLNVMNHRVRLAPSNDGRRLETAVARGLIDRSASLRQGGHASRVQEKRLTACHLSGGVSTLHDPLSYRIEPEERTSLRSSQDRKLGGVEVGTPLSIELARLPACSSVHLVAKYWVPERGSANGHSQRPFPRTTWPVGPTS